MIYMTILENPAPVLMIVTRFVPKSSMDCQM